MRSDPSRALTAKLGSEAEETMAEQLFLPIGASIPADLGARSVQHRRSGRTLGIWNRSTQRKGRLLPMRKAAKTQAEAIL